MKILQTDNGSEFANTVVRELTTLYGIDHRLSTPYHPRANGLVERQNKEVGRRLRKAMETATGRWQDWLPFVQMSLNHTENSRTKTTPFELMFGRPFIGLEDFRSVDSNLSVGDAIAKRVKQVKNLQEVVWPAIAELSHETRERMVQRMDEKRPQMSALEPGQAVMAVDQTRGSK